MSVQPSQPSLIFIDRTKTGRGSSAANRDKYLKRIKASVKAARNIALGGLTSDTKQTVNPITVARQKLNEPSFHYDHSTGVITNVLIGNQIFERGDEIPMKNSSEGQGDGSGNGAGNGGNGEDDFIVHVTKDEFLNIFFEDCELPNMQHNSKKQLKLPTFHKAGYRTSGSPATLSVIKSFKNSLGRRIAIKGSFQSRIDELTEQDNVLAELIQSQDIELERACIKEEITELTSRKGKVMFFDDMDLRYRKMEQETKRTADAIFVMIMDVSGSMDQERKTMARKFFSLQYAFLKRHYPDTQLVFIAHTETAEEMDEDEFFSTRISGGTVVSPAYELALEIIQERFDANVSNIYLSQASDGDNMESDNANLIPALEQSGLLSKIRHMSYIQTCPKSQWHYSHGMWDVLQSIAHTHPEKFGMQQITSDAEVFDAFKAIYHKQ
jgi:uncharacterized sporulation protein YeaH/YhbH (DUF444 family)